VVPWKGGEPHTIKYNMHPNAQMSELNKKKKVKGGGEKKLLKKL
jgi:hypothetical protein